MSREFWDVIYNAGIPQKGKGRGSYTRDLPLDQPPLCYRRDDREMSHHRYHFPRASQPYELLSRAYFWRDQPPTTL